MRTTYTLDKLVLDLRVELKFLSKFMTALGSGRGFGLYVNIKYWQSTKLAAYFQNFSLEVDNNGNSFYIGVSPNWESRDSFFTWCRLEFNPAKVGEHDIFRLVWYLLLSHSKHADFKRFDVAIDMPVERENVWLLKDRRRLVTYEYSQSNKTQYLGQRSQHGQVKLYNKQLEAGLSFPLTRVEVTMDYENCTFTEFERVFPSVVYMDTGQMKLDGVEADGTERVLMLSCLEHPDYLKMLGRKMGKKIERILEQYVQKLKPEYDSYKKILTQILDYGKIDWQEDFWANYREYVEVKNIFG